MPLRASNLTTDQAYLFHYPFRALPCFLINLGKTRGEAQTSNGEDGSHEWPGGAGKHHNLVSYVAVCTHQLSYPNKAASVIRYAAADSELAGKPGMIVCCTMAACSTRLRVREKSVVRQINRSYPSGCKSTQWTTVCRPPESVPAP